MSYFLHLELHNTIDPITGYFPQDEIMQIWISEDLDDPHIYVTGVKNGKTTPTLDIMKKGDKKGMISKHIDCEERSDDCSNSSFDNCPGPMNSDLVVFLMDDGGEIQYCMYCITSLALPLLSSLK
jgi:hypothetical protein